MSNFLDDIIKIDGVLAHILSRNDLSGAHKYLEREVRRLDLEPNSIVLDAGCGFGGHSLYIATQYDYCVDAIDISNDMCALFRQKMLRTPRLHNRISISTADIWSHPFTRKYDLILNINTELKNNCVIETINFFKTLSNTGYLIIGNDAEGEEEFKWIFERIDELDFLSIKNYRFEEKNMQQYNIESMNIYSGAVPPKKSTFIITAKFLG